MWRVRRSGRAEVKKVKAERLLLEMERGTWIWRRKAERRKGSRHHRPPTTTSSAYLCWKTHKRTGVERHPPPFLTVSDVGHDPANPPRVRMSREKGRWGEGKLSVSAVLASCESCVSCFPLRRCLPYVSPFLAPP